MERVPVYKAKKPCYGLCIELPPLPHLSFCGIIYDTLCNSPVRTVSLRTSFRSCPSQPGGQIIFCANPYIFSEYSMESLALLSARIAKRTPT